MLNKDEFAYLYSLCFVLTKVKLTATCKLGRSLNGDLLQWSQCNSARGLVEAAEIGDIDLVKLYLTKYVAFYKDDPTSTHSTITTSIIQAIRGDYVDIVELLLPYLHDYITYHFETIIMQAVVNGKLRILKYLINNAENIVGKDELDNFKQANYLTHALNQAAGYGCIEICKFLLEKGAIVTDRTIKSAELYGHDDLVRLLKSFPVVSMISIIS